ncbi:hypothetical protein [Sphingobacterium suaedae]|uniref:DUF479 domain-containing protein n=1 Tax=Sphingobacterium suaedae TaxID=1686402 RepID=A0ABW5KHH7_9SPHI
MNFLSHYYFERYSPHAERILGALLPDLLKNVDKQYNFHPQRFEEVLFSHPKTRWVSEGWYRHIEVDKLFHSSNFFLQHCHVLRKELDPLLTALPIRASFLAHIAIELLLDHLLIEQQLVNPTRLYEQLDHVQRGTIERYLRVIGDVNVPGFLQFYEQFLSWRYILDYSEVTNLSHSLFNICKRVWAFEVTPVDHHRLTSCLQEYKEKHMGNYVEIFHYIQDKIVYLA